MMAILACVMIPNCPSPPSTAWKRSVPIEFHIGYVRLVCGVENYLHIVSFLFWGLSSCPNISLAYLICLICVLVITLLWKSKWKGNK
ncbi:hypothetical protein ACJIZ3_005660 [Penstemon smallii]|uniref:Uncharacterized protein n=1 Tax=Penstemon smallii TaxID=265156 RepID=A0ABD3S5I1_9LAMI